MYSPVTSQFLASCRQSSRVATVCDFYISGTLAKSNVPVVSGSVTSDANADIRRSASLTLIAPTQAQSDQAQGLVSGRISTDLRDLFAGVDIFQMEVVLKSGFVYSFGSYELVPLGTFMVWSAAIEFSRGDVITLELFDRSKYMEQAQILKLYDFGGTSARTAIQTLVTNSVPGTHTVQFQAGLTDITLPGGTTFDNTHLDAAISIAETLGAVFYWDATGVPRVDLKKRLGSDATLSSAVFTCNTGEPDGNIISLNRSFSRDEIFNGVSVFGAQPNEAVPQAYGEAFDLNPASRTYWQGPFGKSMKRLDKPELVTNQQCYQAALAELNRSVEGSVPAHIEMLYNPALVVDDVVAVYFPVGDPEVHLVDSIDYDISEAHMSITTRGKAA